MSRKATGCLLLALLLLFVSTAGAFAETTQEKISDARARQQETKSSLETTREKIAELETKKGESETYLQELNTQLEDLRAQLEQLQQDYDAKQEELLEVQEDLLAAKEDEQEQYEAMKLRIRYMYENSTTSYYELLFSSESISEFLNQAENISKISAYDRKMLVKYRQIKATIEEKEQQVAQEKEEIAALQTESEDKRAAVEELVETTYNEIRSYQDSIEDQESEESALLEKINEQEEAINALLKQQIEEEAAQKAAEEAEAAAEAAKQAASSSSGSSSSGSTSSSGQSSSASSSGSSSSGSTSSSGQSSTSSSDSSSGTAPSSSVDETSSSGTYLGRFKLTAYCACSKCCGKWAGGGTASGATPTAGRTVAMAGVPFGTKLLINGHVYTVEDRGTAYGHVDIFFGSHSEALAFGMTYADVYQVD